MVENDSLELKRNKWIVWGCGRNCKVAMTELRNLIDNVPSNIQGLLPEIDFFIDTDANKQNKQFMGKSVKKPDVLKSINENPRIFISPKNNKEIREQIVKEYHDKTFALYDYTEFFKYIHAIVINNISYIINSGAIKNNYLKKCLMYVKSIQDGTYQKNKHLDYCAFVCALKFLFVDEIQKVNDIVSQIFDESKNNAYGKSVALISDRLTTGGAERVTAIMATKLFEEGYRVLLINQTESMNDYQYASGISREIIYINFETDMYLYLCELMKIIMENGITSVCFHIPYEGLDYYYKAVFCKLIGLRVVTQMHTSVSNFLRRSEGLRRHNEIYKINDTLITLSESDREYWAKYGIRSVYIPNPVNPNLIRAYQNRYRYRYNIIWVGRLDNKNKRILDIIPIMKKVIEIDPKVILRVYGATVNQAVLDELRRGIEYEKLDKNIELCGFQNDLDEIYGEAGIMLFTSPGEGFPMVILEAKAFSIPIVMYQLDYLELAKKNTGIISVEQGNAEQAAEMIIKLEENHELYVKKSKESWLDAQRFINFDTVKAWDAVFTSM
ncbi:glycosyltransferase family 4 protein [Butyrivibrio sp. WCE2006]|uniref:glycosyltransferase family 4 protein n=1 Tax=Butyrivibrio sp. WCE2006 TaxID=1410611 RepID=UPI0005D1E2F6|nr:glycosyltransferase family 4 protein [Butyrivibrio sp. WCE2006]